MTDRTSDPRAQPSGVLPARRSHERADADGVDPREILDRLQELPVYSWRESTADPNVIERLGPAAEDFHDVFGVGTDPDDIAAGDADAVALAAIQGLVDRLDERHATVERQQRRLRKQRELIDDQRTDIESLRERLESHQAELARVRRTVEELDSSPGGSD